MNDKSNGEREREYIDRDPSWSHLHSYMTTVTTVRLSLPLHHALAVCIYTEMSVCVCMNTEGGRFNESPSHSLSGQTKFRDREGMKRRRDHLSVTGHSLQEDCAFIHYSLIVSFFGVPILQRMSLIMEFAVNKWLLSALRINVICLILPLSNPVDFFFFAHMQEECLPRIWLPSCNRPNKITTLLPRSYNGPLHLTKMAQCNYKAIDGCLYVF